MFDFLRYRGLGDLALGQSRKDVVSLLGRPTDTSVQREPEILKWFSLQCSFRSQRLDFIGIYFEGMNRVTLPPALKKVEVEINGALPRLLDAVIRSGTAEVQPIKGLTFDDQSGFNVGDHWILVMANEQPYALSTMSRRWLLEAFEAEFMRSRRYAEAAVEQISDEQLHVAINPRQNSIAVIMQHMAGNMLSRFTDFLTSDGEKPTRDRDGEFVDRKLDRGELMALWARGWECLVGAIRPLTDEDLSRVVTIRGEPHTVSAALARQVAHYAWHAGQIALIAKHLKGEGWQYLTIPPGGSEEFNRRMGV